MLLMAANNPSFTTARATAQRNNFTIKSMTKIHLRLLELTLLMVGVPVAMALWLPPKAILPVLLGMVILCRALIGRQLPLRVFWNARAVCWANLRPLLLRFLACAAMLFAATYALHPELLFSFVKASPAFWAIVMLLYPLISVIAQELVFRVYVFERFASVLSPRALVWISALGFGFAHIVLKNWVAPLLCLVGGVIFATTYRRHRSLALVSIEHALYGDFLFTLGLGRYFYHGAVGG